MASSTSLLQRSGCQPDEHDHAGEPERHAGDLVQRQRLAKPDRGGDGGEEGARRVEDRAGGCA